MNIVSYHSDKVGGFKGDKKLGLGNMVNISLDKGLKLSTVRSFQDIKTPNIEKLDKIR